MLKLLSETAIRGREISFFVPGEPRGKGRPVNLGRNVVKDEKTAAYENLIALAASAALGDENMFDGAAAVHFVAYFQPPASDRRGQQKHKLSGGVHFIKRPDIDNIAKVIMDACQQVVFSNDNRVSEIVGIKVYGEKPGVLVTIIELLDP